MESFHQVLEKKWPNRSRCFFFSLQVGPFQHLSCYRNHQLSPYQRSPSLIWWLLYMPIIRTTQIVKSNKVSNKDYASMRTKTNPKYAQHFFSTCFFIFLPCANITLPKAFSPVIDKNNDSVGSKPKAAKTKLETK